MSWHETLPLVPKLRRTIQVTKQPPSPAKVLLRLRRQIWKSSCEVQRQKGFMSETGCVDIAVAQLCLSKAPAAWAQKAVASCRKVSRDHEIAEALWNETLDQASLEKKWAFCSSSPRKITGFFFGS